MSLPITDFFPLLLSLLLAATMFISIMRCSFLYGLKMERNWLVIFVFTMLILTSIFGGAWAAIQLLFLIAGLFVHLSPLAPEVEVLGTKVILDSSFTFFAFLGLQVFLGIVILRLAEMPDKKETHTNESGKLIEPIWMRAGRRFFLVSFILVVIYLVANNLFTNVFFRETYAPWLKYYFRALPFALILIKGKQVYKRQKEVTDYKDKDFEVLFLRSFHLDDIVFANVKAPTEEYGDLIDKMIYPYQSKYDLTFEKYFGFQVRRKLGDFVGIGKPDNRYPKDGLNTIFPKEDEWQTLVASMISHARMIFVQAGNSEYLKYELNLVLNSAAIHKLYLFTEPYDPPVYGAFKKAILKWITSNPNSRSSPVKLKRQELPAFLDRCGLYMDFMPPAGSVICFSDGGNAVLLKSGCLLPSHYIDAVKKHQTSLDAGRKS